jgi:hypothetical protein
MSNFDSTKKRSKKKTLPDKVSHKHDAEISAKTRWSFIQSNLSSAAIEWTEDTPKTAIKTPEEVQFEKVKNMIENLKDKLNEF